MMVDIILAYALPMTAIWSPMLWLGAWSTCEAALSARACVRACPEGDVIGMIDGKATLIEPPQCIGHGGCQDEAVRAILDEAGSEAVKGETGSALLLAAPARRESTVALLLRAGAPINFMNSAGETALGRVDIHLNQTMAPARESQQRLY